MDFGTALIESCFVRHIVGIDDVRLLSRKLPVGFLEYLLHEHGDIAGKRNGGIEVFTERMFYVAGK